MDTVLNHLEKKTLKSFLLLYLGTVLGFLLVVGYFYFSLEKARIIKKYEQDTRKNKGIIISSLMRGADCSDIKQAFAIYQDNKIICSNIKTKFEMFDSPRTISKDNHIYFHSRVPPRIMQRGLIVLQSKDYSFEIAALYKNVFLFFILSFAFFGLSGWFLARMILKPWKISKERIENFIKDATHDLNTPISTITMSLERISSLCNNQKEKKYINHAIVGAKTLKMIYEDLVYMNFKDRLNSRVGLIDMAEFVKSRVLYFSQIAEQKGINIKIDIKTQKSVLKISHKDAARLIDNILANAIKYNKQNGKIDIIVTSNSIAIKDTGIGIPSTQIDHIFDRFHRANNCKGGLGLGLNIVKEICNRYNIQIKVSSTLNVGSTFNLRW